MPESAIALVGESTVYFVAESGTGFHTLPRDLSFCTYAIHNSAPLVVPDATIDLRFADNPLVMGAPFVCFYTGAPLIDRDGYRLGRFCLVDLHPRCFTPEDTLELNHFAELAISRIDLLSTVSDLLRQPDNCLLV